MSEQLTSTCEHKVIKVCLYLCSLNGRLTPALTLPTYCTLLSIKTEGKQSYRCNGIEKNVGHESTTELNIELNGKEAKIELMSGTKGAVETTIALTALRSCTEHHSLGLLALGIGSTGFTKNTL